MLVQFNSDRHITATAALTEHSESSVRGALGGFADQITRVEIHVSDENGADKRGLNDKSCRIEARLSGRPPIAAEKLRHAIASIVGRDNQH